MEAETGGCFLDRQQATFDGVHLSLESTTALIMCNFKP